MAGRCRHAGASGHWPSALLYNSPRLAGRYADPPADWAVRLRGPAPGWQHISRSGLFPAGLLFESAVPAVFYACGTPHNSYSAGPSLAGCTVYTFRAGREADPASARFGADHGKAYICGETSLANGTLLVWHKRGDADTPAGVSE